MRRAILLLAALAAPVLAMAQTSPSAGVVANGTSQGTGEPIRDDKYINLDECSGTVTSNLELIWTVKLETKTPPVTIDGGKFVLYATNDAGTPGTTEPRYCPTVDAPSATPSPIYAGQIGAEVVATVGDPSDSTSVPTTDIVAAATPDGFACSDTASDQNITVCAHYFDSGGSRVGWAIGQLILSLRRPPPPKAGSVVAAGGESALDISWSAAPDPVGSQTQATGYRVIVLEGATEVFRKDVTTLKLRVDGLTNGTTYHVDVYSLSVAMNQSATAEGADGAPQPITDFWEYYRQQDGKEQGGCASGPAGALALLGVAALLAALRRRA